MADLQRYQDFAPTRFDARGLNARSMGTDDDEDRSDWWLVPVSRNRDDEDDPIVASNWDATLRELGGEGPDVEIHRFGHWGPGWFEIVLVRPGTQAEEIAEEIAGRLEEYPLLDEEDQSRREYEADLEGIRDQAGRWVRDGAPEDWPARVFKRLDSKYWGIYSQPGGGHVDEADLLAACRACKLIPPRYLRVRVLALRQVRRPGMPVFYRDVVVKRYNPEYPL